MTAAVILPIDPTLPHLRQALDARCMAAVFGQALHARGALRLEDCRVDRIKYRPRRNCHVSYVLRLREAQGDNIIEQRVVARFCADGDAARRYSKAYPNALHPTPAGPMLLHLPELDALVHWWPNDAKLNAPSLLADDAQLRARCLPEVVAGLSAGRGHLIEHRTTIVQYVPEHRLSARIDMRLNPGPDASPVWRRVYAKADSERRGADTHAVMQALSASRAQQAGRLRTPLSIAWQPGVGLHWQAAIGGQCLLDVEPQVGVKAAAGVGAMLAALHATPVPSVRVMTQEEIRTRAHDAAATMAMVDPAWQPRLDRLVRALDAGAGLVAAQPAVTLHGDLHPRNVLVDGDRFALIDLDNVCRGPALIELGAWIADLLYRAVLGGASAAAVEPSWRAFVAAYREAAAGGAIDERGLAWSTAWNLLCLRAYRCVINLKPGRFAMVPQLLALAEAIASAGTLDAGTLAGIDSRHDLATELG